MTETSLPNQFNTLSSVEKFDIVKEEISRMSESQGYLDFVVTLDALVPKEFWNPSGISLRSRIESGEVTASEVIATTEKLSQSYVPVTEGAAKRCVDGRGREGYDDNDPAQYGLALGPQIQGGSADEAVIFRVIEGHREGATLLEDIELVSQRSSRFAPGVHTDNHAEPPKSGCGALDGQSRKWDMLQSEDKRLAIVEATEQVMTLAGGSFDPNKAARFKGVAAELLAHKDSYLPAPEAVFAKITELRGNIEKLAGKHNEFGVVLNFVNDTTLNTSHFAAQTGNKLQAFGLDMWAIVEEYGDDAQYIVQDAIETLMDLTDGSLLVLVRKPRNSETELPDISESLAQVLAA